MTEEQFQEMNRVVDRYRELAAVIDECQKARDRLTQYRMSDMFIGFFKAPTGTIAVIPSCMQAHVRQTLDNLFKSKMEEAATEQLALRLHKTAARPTAQSSFVIPAEVHSDDRVLAAAFDAQQWFMQADAREIDELAECGWGGSQAADDVARQSQGLYAEVERVFAYVLAHPDMGFECHVEKAAALEWLRINRPQLHKELIDEEGT